MEFKHKSVLLDETIDSLNIKPDGIYVDGTLGGGGHSLEICKRLSDKGRLIGIDQDLDAIAAATERLKDYKDRVTIVHSNYQDIDAVLKNCSVSGVDGIVLDLGVSSYQLDNVERGFTYREDTPLDMRMNQESTMTAKDIVNEYSEMELYHVIRDYGEDSFAKNIAKHIVKARQEQVIETTGQLNEIIKAAIPAKVRQGQGHPSKKTFQAIRIELNHELDVLENSLDTMISWLNPGGRLSVITFHSLEDRIVKTIFKRNMNPCTCPPEFPVCVCGKKPTGKVIDMAQQVRRQMNYVDGTAARQMYAAPARRVHEPERKAPSRRVAPQQRPQERPKVRRRVTAQTKKTLAFSAGYMLFMAFMVCLVVGSSVLMLYLNTKISTQQNNISALEAELEKIEDDNAAHKLRLNNMYTLDDIYNVATNELGMVYAKRGQIIYYDSANEDYVKQYQDVPGSN